jgi:hypothetical protein
MDPFAQHATHYRAVAPSDVVLKPRLHQLGNPYRLAPDVRPLLAAMVYLPEDKSHKPVPVYNEADLEAILMTKPSSLVTNPAPQLERPSNSVSLKKVQDGCDTDETKTDHVAVASRSAPVSSASKEGLELPCNGEQLPQLLGEMAKEDIKMLVSAAAHLSGGAENKEEVVVAVEGIVSSSSAFAESKGTGAEDEFESEEMEGSVPEPKGKRMEEDASQDDGPDQKACVPNMINALA